MRDREGEEITHALTRRSACGEDCTLSHKTQTLIVEAVDPSDVPSSQRCLTVLPLHGKMFKSWLKLAMPYAKSKDGDPGSMCIIHSIVPYLAPYEPRKRARDAEMAQNEREVRELVGGA